MKSMGGLHDREVGLPWMFKSDDGGSETPITDFASDWQNEEDAFPGNGLALATYSKVNGRMYLSGRVYTPTGHGDGVGILHLPAGMAPEAIVNFAVAARYAGNAMWATTMVAMRPDGLLRVEHVTDYSLIGGAGAGLNVDKISLDGISFRVN